MDFKCVHCEVQSDVFKTLIDHCYTPNPDTQLEYYSLSVNPDSGKTIYMKKKYPFIPFEIRSRGQKLTVTKKTNKIKIENDKDNYKTATLCYKSYLSDLLHLYTPSR
jgi:hypothetical protein